MMRIEEDLRESERRSGGRGFFIAAVILLLFLVITGAFSLKRLFYEKEVLERELIRIQKENEVLKGKIEVLKKEIKEGNEE